MERPYMSPMEYNTQQQPLRMSEYGRNIQNMVDYCVSIPDREERTACAHQIAKVMARLFPAATNNGDEHKIWDHINIMADFQLDIDFPCEVMTKEEVQVRPQRLEYSTTKPRYRLYGKNIEVMIKSVADLPESAEKHAMIMMIANHMKKLLVVQNQEFVADMRVLNDLVYFSEGKINPDPATFVLHDYSYDAKPQQGGGKKKKKKK